jgi:predicted nucleic acid-binding protein
LKVVDSTFLIGLLRGDPEAVEKARELDEEGGVATTAVNVYEVAYGVHRGMSNPSQRMGAFERVMSNLDVLPLDGGSALRAAKISGTLDKSGEGIDPFDALIAGIAIENGADCLVTRNMTHFQRIRGLKIEDH